MKWPAVRARDLMKTDVVTIPQTATLAEAVRRFADNRISGMPVTDESGHVCGIVSIRDVLDFQSDDSDGVQVFSTRSFYMADEDVEGEFGFDEIQVPEETSATVADAMSSQIYDVDVDATIEQIVRSLAEHRIHRVLVKQRGKHVGIVSAMDVLTALSTAE